VRAEGFVGEPGALSTPYLIAISRLNLHRRRG